MKDPDPLATLLSERWLPPDEVAALRLEEELGSGAAGRVFRALTAEGSVAVKVAKGGDEAPLAREARLLALVGGIGLPRLLGVGRSGARLAVVMEMVTGQTLSGIPAPGLASGSAIARVDLARRLLVQVGSTLLQLHRLGVSHGDVKPENILLAESGDFVLIDLGLAQRRDSVLGPRDDWQPEADAAETTPEQLGGTPAYLDPASWPLQDESGARSRDAFALALSAAELVDPRLTQSSDPRRGSNAQLPPELARLLLPFLTLPPARRPGLDWLLGELGASGSISEELVARRIRATYLMIRQEQVRRHVASGPTNIEVAGICGEWLGRLADVTRVLSDTRLDLPEPSVGTGRPLGMLPAHAAARLTSLVAGPHAGRVRLPQGGDTELVGRLFRAVTRSRLGCVPPALLWDGPELARSDALTDSVDLALELSKKPVAAESLQRIEGLAAIPERLGLAAARALARQGETFRALTLLERLEGSIEVYLLAADLERRRGASANADQWLGRIGEAQPQGEALLCYLALQARRKVDAAAPDEALELLTECSPHAAVCEVRALALLGTSRPEEALGEVQRGSGLSRDDEQAARLEGVRGMIQHHLGHSAAAQAAFTRASELAAMSGALLEEATYSTGLSAAASDAGRWEIALAAAERAADIFESLEREGAAARAVLAQVSVLASLGRPEELVQRAARGLALARLSSDRRCAGYLQLCLADGLERTEGEVAARAADVLLRDGTAEDRLRVLARLVRYGGVEEHAGDALSAQVVAADPRAEYWGARAAHGVQARERGELGVGEADRIIAELTALSALEPAPISLGPALLAGRELALGVGRVDAARALHARARVIAGRLLTDAGPTLGPAVAELDWVSRALSASGEGFDVAQLSDVENLLRTVSQRSGLRDLLRLGLDLMLLWTGVERGLILLTAPDDRLVVRCARNLSREDLSDVQLELSRSMAARAMREGRPVVAVDAQHEAGDLRRSAHTLKLRSVLAVPLSAHGQILGVAYLDDRLRPGAFGPKELAWTQLIATVTALAVSEERDRLQLRRAVRRTRRAEQKLAGQLALTRGELELASRELERARSEVSLRGDYSDIIGRGPAMTRVLELVDRISVADLPVLIVGESGTGKELVARAIARGSPRKTGPFVAENCSALPESLLESTLFGHRRGAFTGATRDQAGLFELADGGTLFLDEIGEMTLGMQAKLLRVLQDGAVRALGASRPRKVDVRIICATHRDLSKMVQEGTFREDLFYRLSVVPVNLPPLRQRPEDLDALVAHFMERYDPRGKRTVSRAVMERFRSFSWPGNVRQLENEMRRLLLLGGQEISMADLSPALRDVAVEAGQTLRDKLDNLERRLIAEALEVHRGNRTRAAESLGVSRFGLQKMMQRLAIDAGAAR